MAEDLTALREAPLFSAMSDKDMHHLQQIAKVVTHRAGQPVVEQDQTAIGFHMILEGAAEASIGGVTVAQLGPGDYFGEMSLLDGKPRSATVTAATDLRTMVIPAWDFGRLLDAQPGMMKALLVELCRRLRKVEGARG